MFETFYPFNVMPGYKCLRLCLMIFCMKVSVAQNLSNEEQDLYDIIMAYREIHQLPSIPLSEALTIVAKTHVKDLMVNHPNQGICNLHSWSDKGNWSPCCYTSDHSKVKCVVNKPRELTSYNSNGYEIAFWSSSTVNASGALNAWKKSKGHNAVIINRDNWHNYNWKAIGIAISGNYAVVWFGSALEE